MNTIHEMVKLIAAMMGPVSPTAEYRSPYDFVLREGEEMPLTPGGFDRERWGELGQPQLCFENAFLLAHSNEHELGYVEGYSDGSVGFPVRHAWCVDLDGNVVEPTWDGDRYDAATYFGVQIPVWLVEQLTDISGHYGVLNDWANGWPLLQRPFADLLTHGIAAVSS